jgi:hypothetical protein
MTSGDRQVTWVLESDAFPGRQALLEAAIQRAGHRLVQWSDEWWIDGNWPRLGDSAVIFQGSLGNAARIRKELPWRPGAYCDIQSFSCSSWYARAQEWLAHKTWRIVPANVLVADTAAALGPMAEMASVFVRPDSAVLRSRRQPRPDHACRSGPRLLLRRCCYSGGGRAREDDGQGVAIRGRGPACGGRIRLFALDPFCACRRSWRSGLGVCRRRCRETGAARTSLRARRVRSRRSAPPAGTESF